jgi:ribonuclease VapC
MVIDSSALLALLLGEAAAPEIARAIAADPRRLMSAFSALEAGIVIEEKKGEAAGRELDLLMHRAEIDVVVMDRGQVELARSAYRTYGKGRHPAGLNIGDCCSYALSRFTGEPLLYVGEDFAKTDVARVESSTVGSSTTGPAEPRP